MRQNTYPTVFQCCVIFLYVVIGLWGTSLLHGVINPGLALWIHQLVLFVFPIAFISRRYRVDWRALCRFQPVSKKQLFLSALIGIGAFPLFFVLSAIVEAVLIHSVGEFPNAASFLQQMRGDGLTFLFFISGVMVLAPICEELLFRGLLQTGFGGYASKRGWILTGLLFGLMHCANQVSSAAGTLFLGLILSYVAFTTGTIWTTILIHAVVNALGSLLVHIPAYFNITLPIQLLFTPLSLIIATVLLVYAIRQLPRSSRTATPPPRFTWKSFGALGLASLFLLSFSALEVSVRMSAAPARLDLTPFDTVIELPFETMDADDHILYTFSITETMAYDMAYALTTQIPTRLQLVNLSGTGFLYRDGDVFTIYEGSEILNNARFTGYSLQPGEYQLELQTRDRQGNLRLGITLREPSAQQLAYTELLDAVQQRTFTAETYHEDGFVLVYHGPLTDGEHTVHELEPSTGLRKISVFTVGEYEELSLIYQDEEKTFTIVNNFNTTIGYGLPASKHPGQLLLSTKGATGEIYLYVFNP